MFNLEWRAVAVIATGMVVWVAAQILFFCIMCDR